MTLKFKKRILEVISEIWNHVQKYEIMCRPWPAARAAMDQVDWSHTSTDEWMKSGWYAVVMVWWAARTGRRVELSGFKSGFSCSHFHAVVPGVLACVHIYVHIYMSYVCVYICVCMYMYKTCIYAYKCMCICICICMHVYTCAHVRVRIFVHILWVSVVMRWRVVQCPRCAFVFLCICMRMHMCVCKHSCAFSLQWVLRTLWNRFSGH